MKSSSKVYSSAASKHIASWNVTDLDVQSNVAPADMQSEGILAFFGAGSETASPARVGESRSIVRPSGTDLLFTNWMPGDFDSLSGANQPEEWEFVEPTSDFFAIPEQHIWKEKFDAEKERIEVIRNARAQAEAILSEARLEAEKIVQQAQAEIEQSKREGYESARRELQSALAAAHAMIDETRQWQVALVKDSEPVLMDMLKEIARAMFGEGVRLDPSALQVNLNRIMENAQRLGDLKIFLNPQDANALDPSWSNYQLLITSNKVHIVPSEKIRPGGCFVKGSTGSVDARVETQLSAVLNAIAEVNEVGK